MRSSSKKQVKLDIETLEFIVTPHSITFQKGSKQIGRSFYIDIDKGPQFIKRFDEDITFPQSNTYIFQSKQSVTITVRNAKTANYSFTLYVNSQAFQSYIDTFPIDLIGCYQQYRQELSQYSEEYISIMENMTNRIGLGYSWSSLKEQLKGHQQILEGKNSEGSIHIKYCVSINTSIDRYADSMLSKTKLQTMSSIGSKKSTSSNNSKRQIKINGVSNFLPQKTDKSSHLLQPNDSSVKNPEKSSREDSPTPQAINSNGEAADQSSQKPILFLPLQSVLHKAQYLSDIIEQSYEGSSNINSVERTDRKWKQLPQITQEIDIVQRKTQKILPNKGYDKDQLRRGSSWDQNQRHFSNKEIQPLINEANYKNFDLLGRKEFDSKGKETITCLQPQNNQLQGKCWWIVLCIICLLWLLICFTEVLQGNRFRRGQKFPRAIRQKIVKKVINR